jgi:hypothetical protein
LYPTNALARISPMISVGLSRLQQLNQRLRALSKLVQQYHGHDGMSNFLRSFGEVVKVLSWTPTSIKPCEDLSATVELSAKYQIRDGGDVYDTRELHKLQLRAKTASDELEIATVVVNIVEMQKLER